MEDLLKGAYDLHIHTAPDVVQRKCGDLELARRLGVHAGADVRLAFTKIGNGFWAVRLK